MDKPTLTLILLEDNASDAALIHEQLVNITAYSFKVILATDKDSFLAALDTQNPDMILCAYQLLSFPGSDALNLVNERKMPVPFIFVSDFIDAETAVEMIKAGAWDYVFKNRLHRLPLAVMGALRLKEEKINVLRAELQTRQLLKTIEQSPIHIIMMNANFEIEYVNTRFTETTGYTLDDLRDQESWHKILENLPENYCHEMKHKGKLPANWQGEIQSRKKDGTAYWESVSISPLLNEENQLTHFIIIKEDISSRKRIIQQLIKARNKAEHSDKLKEAFLQNLSHEIRTPLNAIVGFSSLLDDAPNLSDQLKEYISIIQSSSNQLLSIVNDILTISRIQTGQEIVATSEVYINSVLDEMYLIYKSQAALGNITLSILKENNDPDFVIYTDETKLVQIFNNLLNNALKFTHQGSVTFGYVLRKNKIEFFVRDTGIGIVPENHKVIFDRFRQAETTFNRKYGGSGLGLSISKSFAELLGGTLWVESVIGQGATFYLQLPCQYEHHFAATAASLEHPYPKKEITVLVAEDERDNYRLIEAFLDDACITLIHAKNGKEAVEICQNHGPVDLILMDIKMPEMDGITAMTEIKKTMNVPIIAQTAYALEHEKQQLLEIGFVDYIAKPLKKEDLIGKVIKWTTP